MYLWYAELDGESKKGRGLDMICNLRQNKSIGSAAVDQILLHYYFNFIAIL